MRDLQIYDNIIPQGYQDQIEADLLRWQFFWNYFDDVTNRNYGDNSGLVHLAYNLGNQPSEWYPFIKPLIYSIEQATGDRIHELLRIRVGFLMPDESAAEHNTPHIDFTVPHKTACYYVNDSDGDTIVFDQSVADMSDPEISEQTIKDYVSKARFTIAGRCSPKKGRLCVFDGYHYHSSSKPKNHKRRLVITVNYVPQR